MNSSWWSPSCLTSEEVSFESGVINEEELTSLWNGCVERRKNDKELEWSGIEFVDLNYQR